MEISHASSSKNSGLLARAHTGRSRRSTARSEEARSHDSACWSWEHLDTDRQVRGNLSDLRGWSADFGIRDSESFGLIEHGISLRSIFSTTRKNRISGDDRLDHGSALRSARSFVQLWNRVHLHGRGSAVSLNLLSDLRDHAVFEVDWRKRANSGSIRNRFGHFLRPLGNGLGGTF